MANTPCCTPHLFPCDARYAQPLDDGQFIVSLGCGVDPVSQKPLDACWHGVGGTHIYHVNGSGGQKSVSAPSGQSVLSGWCR